MTMETRCVVVDFDGVLVESNELKRVAYYDAFVDVPESHSLVAEALAECPEGDRHDVIALVLKKIENAQSFGRRHPVRSAAEYAARYNALCEHSVGLASETPGCSSALRALGNMVPLYVNSATPQEPLRRLIAQRGWAACFEDVLGRPRTKVENLRHIRARERLASEEIMFVGDTESDRKAAEICGCSFVGFLSGMDAFDSVELRVSSLHELEDLL